jgi:hypothetical protein
VAAVTETVCGWVGGWVRREGDALSPKKVGVDQHGLLSCSHVTVDIIGVPGQWRKREGASAKGGIGEH